MKNNIILSLVLLLLVVYPIRIVFADLSQTKTQRSLNKRLSVGNILELKTTSTGKFISIDEQDIYLFIDEGQNGINSINIKTGEVKNFLSIEKPVIGIEIIGNLIIVSQWEQIQCFDLNTRKELWRYDNNKLSDGYDFYVFNENILLGYSKGILLLNINTGDLINEKLENGYTRILKHNDYLIVSNSRNQKNLIKRINPHTFEVIWEIQDTTDWLNLHYAHISDDSLYHCRDKHTFIYLVRINLKNGDIIWEKEVFDKVISVNQNSIIIWGQGTHFEPDKKFLIALDRFSGEELWKIIFSAYSVNFGFQNNEYLYLYSNEYHDYSYLICTNLHTGKIEQKLGYMNSYLSYLHNNNTFAYYSLYNKNSKQSSIITFTPAADSLTFQINSNTYKPDNDDMTEMDTNPTILQDRTYLPARYVTEPLGGQVFWDATERKVTCKLVAPDNAETEDYKENIVELWIGKPTAKINGIVIQIDPNNPDVVPTIINDRTMVPMRFLAESLGCEVEWVADTKEIILTYTP